MDQDNWELWLRNNPEWQEIKCHLCHLKSRNKESICRQSLSLPSDQAQSEILKLVGENRVLDGLLSKRFAADLAAGDIETND